MKKIILSLILISVGFILQAQISDAVILGGTSADTASYRGTTAYPWYSSPFKTSAQSVFYKFYLKIDTLGGLDNKAKYRIDVEELPAGTTYYRVSRTTFGSAGWTGIDTTFVITNMTTSTSVPLASHYYRLKITPYDSIQNVRISGYLIRWVPEAYK